MLFKFVFVSTNASLTFQLPKEEQLPDTQTLWPGSVSTSTVKVLRRIISVWLYNLDTWNDTLSTRHHEKNLFYSSCFYCCFIFSKSKIAKQKNEIIIF